jgi:hypothetical protein
MGFHSSLFYLQLDLWLTGITTAIFHLPEVMMGDKTSLGCESHFYYFLSLCYDVRLLVDTQ